MVDDLSGNLKVFWAHFYCNKFASESVELRRNPDGKVSTEMDKFVVMDTLKFIAMILMRSATTNQGCVPPPTVECDTSDFASSCTVFNFVGDCLDQSRCRAAKAMFPTTEAELIEAVADARRKRRDNKHKRL
eukprot:Gb_36874 [translate_table: standard]